MAIAEACAEDGRPAYSMSLPRRPGAARDARLLASSALGLWGLGDIEDAATLVVTELMSNAVAHARWSTVRVTVTRTELLVAPLTVSDFSKEVPRLRQTGTEAECGRGLTIIDAVTQGRWESSPDGGGCPCGPTFTPAPLSDPTLRRLPSLTADDSVRRRPDKAPFRPATAFLSPAEAAGQDQ
ncbi:ATP-binding protein [Streptomyces sp. NPDC016469]|uniref:ATP-binding protein n=1 Tax=Streptomyces sp. NPDC016469 TaxID=3157191 RepID=UPI0033CFF992